MSDKIEVSQPTLENLQSINAKNNLGCTDDALQELMSVMKKNTDDLKFIESLEAADYYVKCGRDFRYTKPDDNTNNAGISRAISNTRKEKNLQIKRWQLKIILL